MPTLTLLRLVGGQGTASHTCATSASSTGSWRSLLRRPYRGTRHVVHTDQMCRTTVRNRWIVSGFHEWRTSRMAELKERSATDSAFFWQVEGMINAVHSSIAATAASYNVPAPFVSSRVTQLYDTGTSPDMLALHSRRVIFLRAFWHHCMPNVVLNPLILVRSS